MRTIDQRLHTLKKRRIVYEITSAKASDARIIMMSCKVDQMSAVGSLVRSCRNCLQFRRNISESAALQASRGFAYVLVSENEPVATNLLCGMWHWGI
jgi:hypothetical protein